MKDITDYIGTGRESARTAREICGITGLKERDFHALIEAARRKGVPICASKAAENPGYYIAATREELDHYVKALTRQEDTTRETREAIAAKIPGLPSEYAADYEGDYLTGDRPKQSRARAERHIIRPGTRRKV